MSDLHLETQEFPWRLPKGDVLVIAGDLCHAACLEPSRTDPYAVRQRDRVMRFVESATSSFAHVLLVAGDHDHYDGVFQDTVPALRRYLPGITVLDNDHADIGGVRFFGTTLWSGFDGANEATMEKVRRGVGAYFFVKIRDEDGRVAKFRPGDALQAHHASLDALKRSAGSGGVMKTVVITHHCPSRKGLNPLHVGNGLDGAYASDLDDLIASLESVPVWVHGHTHIRRSYRIGETVVRANCRGFENREASARSFAPRDFFDL